MLDSWKKLRACAKDSRPLWDIDAGVIEHKTAVWICNRRCPVRDACFQDTEHSMKLTTGQRPHGVFAGLVWDQHVSQTIDEFHTRKERKDGTRAPQTSPIGAELECESRNCKNRFVITKESTTKRFCTRSCYEGERMAQRADAAALR